MAQTLLLLFAQLVLLTSGYRKKVSSTRDNFWPGRSHHHYFNPFQRHAAYPTPRPTPQPTEPPVVVGHASASVSLSLFGTLPADYPANNPTSFTRPNFLTFERCTGDSSDTCESCTQTASEQSDCMSTAFNSNGMVDLHVTSSHWSRFLTSFALRCQNGTAATTLSLQIRPAGMASHYRVYVNGQQRDADAWSSGSFYNVPISDNLHDGVFEVQVEFVHASSLTPPYDAGEFYATILGAAPAFVTCEDSKVCVSKLTYSDEARKLRGDNELQLECLMIDAADVTVPSACNDWRECLSLTGMQDAVRQLLQAGLRNAAPPSQASTASDADGCIDPKLADPEGWTCNCMEKWEAKCAQAGFAGSPDCLTASFCMSNLVCSSWKEKHCSNAVVMDIQNRLAALPADPALLQESQVWPHSLEATADLERHAEAGNKFGALDAAMGSKSCI